jgi:hypothetical protein
LIHQEGFVHRTNYLIDRVARPAKENPVVERSSSMIGGFGLRSRRSRQPARRIVGAIIAATDGRFRPFHSWSRRSRHQMGCFLDSASVFFTFIAEMGDLGEH